jgi:uncharacterized protein YdbL (DUF1318 family)
MNDTALTDFTPIDFQHRELDLPYQEIDIEFTSMKVDWLEAKTLYLADNKLTYQDIANKYGVSLKQVKKWGARQQWRDGRQRVSKLAVIKLTDNLAETAAETNQRHAEMYQQAQELVLAQLEILDVQTTIAVDNAEREERTIAMKELPSTATLLSLTKSLVTAVNGERVCLGLPTAIAPAPVGYKPPIEEDPEFAKLPLEERINRILNQK